MPNTDNIKVMASIMRVISEMPQERQKEMFNQGVFGLGFAIEAIPIENIFAIEQPGSLEAWTVAILYDDSIEQVFRSEGVPSAARVVLGLSEDAAEKMFLPMGYSSVTAGQTADMLEKFAETGNVLYWT